MTNCFVFSPLSLSLIVDGGLQLSDDCQCLSRGGEFETEKGATTVQHTPERGVTFKKKETIEIKRIGGRDGGTFNFLLSSLLLLLRCR